MDKRTSRLSKLSNLLPMQVHENDIAQRLRHMRKNRNLTLAQVEKLSLGKLKAISLGSYERGDRALSLGKLEEIAQFYQTPVEFLITGHTTQHQIPNVLMIDIRQLRTLISCENHNLNPAIGLVSTFISGLIEARGDFNGEVLTLRKTDQFVLSLATGCSDYEILALLKDAKLLIEAK